MPPGRLKEGILKKSVRNSEGIRAAPVVLSKTGAGQVEPGRYARSLVAQAAAPAERRLGLPKVRLTAGS